MLHLSTHVHAKMCAEREKSPQIMVGSCSDRPRTINDISAVQKKKPFISWSVIFRDVHNIW